MIGVESTLPDGFYELFGHEWRKVMPSFQAAGYRVLAVEYRGANALTDDDLAVYARAYAAPATGHWTPEENPEFLVDQVLRFLSR